MHPAGFKTWIAAAVLALAATGAVAQQKPPIKLAHTAPLSGILAQVGILQATAVDIAVADVNASGGVNGSQIVMTHYDDQLKPDQAVLRIREAQQSGNFALVGPMSGTQWETAAPLVNQLKMPSININANKPGITVRPWALRLATTDDTGMPETFKDFLAHYPKVKKVVVMGDVREASGKAAVDLWAELAKQNGLTIVDTITYTTGTTDFSPSAIKVKEAAPDAILISTIAPDALRLAREFKTQGIEVPILANSLLWPGVLPQAMSKTVGQDAANWHTTGFSTNEKSNGDPELYKSFVERYSKKVLEDQAMAQYTPPNVANSSLGYDVILFIADIMRKKVIDGNMPAEKARELIEQGMMEAKGFRGVNEYKIRDTGDGYIPMRALHIDPAKGEWAFLN